MKLPSLSLNEIQNKFSNFLMEKESIGYLFATKKELIEGRLDFYRGNFQAICKQTMKNTFPVMFRLVGEDFFETLVHRYVKKYPSMSGDLTVLGKSFAEFLNGEELVTEYPYFAEVALLEYRVHQTYYAEDSSILKLPEYLQKAGEEVQQTHLVFRPTSTLIHSQWASGQIWLAHQTEEILELNCAVEEACYALVLRHNWEVSIHLLIESSFNALSALQKGDTLENALEKAMSIDVNFDIGFHLQHWFSLNVFSQFRGKESIYLKTNNN